MRYVGSSDGERASSSVQNASAGCEGLTVGDESKTAQWYALRTRSRHEKVVRDQLMARGVEPFLPLWTRWSRWKDRRMQIATPLFPGYCFASFARVEKFRVVTVPGVVSILGTDGAIEPVAAEELDAIRRLVAGRLRYDPCPFLEVGMEAEVVRGPLKGVRGYLVRKGRTTRLVLAVNLIQRGVSLNIDVADVTPV
jgi:transcription termination/antitermination protein NusG